MNRIEVVVVPKNFSWRLWAKKVGISIAFVGVSGLISVWQDDPTFLVLIPTLEAVRNILKHKYKVAWI